MDRASDSAFEGGKATVSPNRWSDIDQFFLSLTSLCFHLGVPQNSYIVGLAVNFMIRDLVSRSKRWNPEISSSELILVFNCTQPIFLCTVVQHFQLYQHNFPKS